MLINEESETEDITKYVINEKKNVIYPNNLHYQKWEVFMTLVLIYSLFLTPYEIAFDFPDE